MNTANILEVPPLEVLGRIAATVGMPATDAARLLVAISHAPEGRQVAAWLDSETVRNSNARVGRAERSESFRRKARGER